MRWEGRLGEAEGAEGPVGMGIGGDRPELGGLDSEGKIALKGAVYPSARASIETQLDALYLREKELFGELGSMEQDFEAILNRGKFVSAQSRARFERVQGSYLAVKRRLDELQAQRPDWIPPGVSAPGDF
jgi:hypothetical protein